MDTLLTISNNGNLVQIALLLLALGVVWILLRFFLKLAFRLFAMGCMAILVLGLLLVIFHYL